MRTAWVRTLRQRDVYVLSGEGSVGLPNCNEKRLLSDRARGRIERRKIEFGGSSCRAIFLAPLSSATGVRGSASGPVKLESGIISVPEEEDIDDEELEAAIKLAALLSAVAAALKTTPTVRETRSTS